MIPVSRDGAVVEWIGTALDIDDLVAAREAQAQTAELLRTTLETMDQGLILYGSDRRVQLHNRRAGELLDLPASVLRVGSPYGAINAYQVARGEFRTSPDDVQGALVAADLAALPDVYERERPNGASLEVRVVRLPDGGYLRTYADVTGRRAGERALRDSEARYRVLAEAASDTIMRRTTANVCTYVSPAARELLGYTPEEMMMLPVVDMLHPDDRERTRAFMQALFSGCIEHDRITHRLRHRDGRWIWVEAHSRLVRDDQGTPVEVITAARDIGERVAAEDALRASAARLRASEERLALALDSGSDGLWDWDLASGSAWFSDRYSEMLGYEPGELEPDLQTWRRLAHPEDAERALDLMREHLRGQTPLYECEYRLLRKDGAEVWVLTRGKVVSRDVSGRALRVVGTQIDITSRKQAERQIAHMATHDGLTGLPNRVLLRDRLDHALAAARRHGGGFAVLACDLDRFKTINDTLGHPAGDALLRVVATRLRLAIRDGDTVARLGGDEFAVIVGHLDDPHSAGLVAKRMIDAVSQPIDLDGHGVSVGVSIGIAVTEGDDDADRLFKRADTALYRAKAAGRNGFSFHEPGLDAAAAARGLLERDLREAVRNCGLMLHYQPIVSAGNEAVGGFEALLRWSHPSRGMVSPAEFIPLAEETGLIVPLGAWVIREACREAASWEDARRVAVNVSAVQFRQPGLEQAVLEALVASGLAPGRLELEITESVLMQDSEAAITCLHRLKALGVRIALDDFGTGYSSLGYLRRFPFHKIKIDRTFIRDIADPDTAAIVRAIVGLGARLGAAITAEGVETPEQLERVRQEGCTEVQGYLYSRPVPPAEALAFARNQRTRAA